MPGRAEAEPAPVDRPPVTVRDPAHPPRPPDLLDSTPRAAGRHWPVVAVVAVVVAVLAAGTVRALDRRAEQDAQRRQQAVVDVVLTDRFGFRDTTGARVSSRASLVALDLEVRNDGPLPVVVDRAVVGDFRFLGDVELAAGQDGVLPLVRTVTCPQDGGEPPLDPVAEGLRLQLVTAAGLRSVLLSPGSLRLDRLRTAARRACGFVPVEDAVRVTAVTVPDVRGIRLVVHNTSVRALRLLEVRLPAGLRLDRAPRLPVDLPGVSSPGAPSVPVLVDLPVVPDCSNAPRHRDGRILPLPRPTLGLVVGDGGSARVGLPPTIDALTALRERYYETCS